MNLGPRVHSRVVCFPLLMVFTIFCVPEAKAKAEADQMAKKADAFKEYREAAMVDMMLKVLPQVAAEISGPISQANKITMIASGDGAIGANRITGEVLDIMGSLPDTVKRMTGVDISAKMITVQD